MCPYPKPIEISLRSRARLFICMQIDLLLLYTYRDLRAKKHRDKNSLFAPEKPADWSYDFFHQ